MKEYTFPGYNSKICSSCLCLSCNLFLEDKGDCNLDIEYNSDCGELMSMDECPVDICSHFKMKEDI